MPGTNITGGGTMKLLTYRNGGTEHVGVLGRDGRCVHPVSAFGICVETMQQFIETVCSEDLERIRNTLDSELPAIPLDQVELCPPIPVLKWGMICIGFNFRSHAEEIARLRGEAVETAKVSYPIYFCKRLARATGDGDSIPYIPNYAQNLDVGVEVCVVIGKDALNIRPEEVGEYILGYTITNDICDTRLNALYTQPFLGKSLDGYMSIGPWIVTSDEFEPEPLFDMKLTVNGEIRQEGNTSGLVFDIPYIVSELSQNMTLKAGTLIATGSPANIHAGDPMKLRLLPGDVVRCEIGGIGILTSVVKEV